MSASEPPPERQVVCDTVVVNYFLAVGEFELLAKMVGDAVQVPRAVFDPEEPEHIADEAASELRRGLRLHRLRASDDGIGGQLRAKSARALPHFEQLSELCSTGRLVALEMSSEELAIYARLRDRNYVRQFSLIEGLGRGEAAALAIAIERRYEVATDDQDAIKALSALAPELRVLRIRGLLIHAIDSGTIEKSRGQAIHAAMLEAGFWDAGTLD